MKLGCCFGVGDYNAMCIAKRAGLEFAEFALYQFDKLENEKIIELKGRLDEIGMSSPAVNCFFVGSHRLTGPEVDYAAIDEYICRLLEKTAPLGFKHITFGSGGARRVPDGFSKEAAFEQLAVLCRDHIAPAMRKYDMICGVEELFTPACNILNSVRETTALVRAVNDDRIRLLVDIFHMGKENEDFGAIREAAGLISHVHISSPKLDGEFPRADDNEDYAGFFGALRDAGYPEDGLVSIEGHANKEDGFEVSVKRSAECMKNYL